MRLAQKLRGMMPSDAQKLRYARSRKGRVWLLSADFCDEADVIVHWHRNCRWMYVAPSQLHAATEAIG